MNMTQAKALVAACEADLYRTLSRGEITDLLLDNWNYGPDWTDATAALEYALAYKFAELIVAGRSG